MRPLGSNLAFRTGCDVLPTNVVAFFSHSIRSAELEPRACGGGAA